MRNTRTPGTSSHDDEAVEEVLSSTRNAERLGQLGQGNSERRTSLEIQQYGFADQVHQETQL
ncbi:MAG: hypothetical protein NPIRA06_23490 [Nitrospirales bacterium]|nr:MAG: hypothetical protein NPIRA06_23490 [Nitrospirales bacterium]